MKSFDTAVLLEILGKVTALCRRLELHKQAAIFEGFIARFQKELPTLDALEEASHALNLAAIPILMKFKDDNSEFGQLQTALSKVMYPEIYEPKKPDNRKARKAVRDSETFWELDGESVLHAITIPDPPKAKAPVTVRLTHSNIHGPFDDADFFVRAGDPTNPTDQGDLDSASDWIQARLVEELVFVDDKEMLRSEAEEPFEEETPWDGTYEAQLTLPAGRQSIEIKVVSQQPELLRSLVLSDWEILIR